MCLLLTPYGLESMGYNAEDDAMRPDTPGL